jgi:hypothetical protein
MKISGEGQLVRIGQHNVLIMGVEYHRMLEGATPDCRDTEEEPVSLVQ